MTNHSANGVNRPAVLKCIASLSSKTIVGLDDADAAVAHQAAHGRKPAERIEHVVHDAGEDDDVERRPIPQRLGKVLELEPADQLEPRSQSALDQGEPRPSQEPVVADDLGRASALEQDRHQALLDPHVQTAGPVAVAAATLHVHAPQQVARLGDRPVIAAGGEHPRRELERVVPGRVERGVFLNLGGLHARDATLPPP